ncbi:hypothetical protein [Xenorhabdus miraniensis]|uniref:Uncharacterized protein n=1 Tax=Xenorhabdus miraniensis TaxID=351674 RepID=A0A2D0JKW8_9GAMM|nr:hypothetical protein [Xenorhabdus miraniensis]PHM46927.1 hypothetical protein Xmir_03722 [Xenorhabdus miraniensis]
MNSEKIEELMEKSGFTFKDIKLLKSINKKNNTTLLNELIELERRFYRSLFALLFVFFVAACIFLIAGKMNLIGFFISLVLTIPLALYITAFKLSYKSFIFMKKYKRLI